jgi:hypothetical protein
MSRGFKMEAIAQIIAKPHGLFWKESQRSSLKNGTIWYWDPDERRGYYLNSPDYTSGGTSDFTPESMDRGYPRCKNPQMDAALRVPEGL